MERLTRKNPDGTFTIIEEHKINEVIEKLAGYENMYEALTTEKNKIISDMEKLKLEDKTKTVTYKQLMANKFMVMNLVSRFDIYTK
jgi:hypothetical protein